MMIAECLTPRESRDRSKWTHPRSCR